MSSGVSGVCHHPAATSSAPFWTHDLTQIVVILLPQPLMCWDCRCESLHLRPLSVLYLGFSLTFTLLSYITAPLTSPSPLLLLFLLKKKIAAHLGISSKHCPTRYSKTGHKPSYHGWTGNPVGGKGSQEQAKESKTPPFPLLGDPQEHQATQP